MQRSNHATKMVQNYKVSLLGSEHHFLNHKLSQFLHKKLLEPASNEFAELVFPLWFSLFWREFILFSREFTLFSALIWSFCLDCFEVNQNKFLRLHQGPFCIELPYAFITKHWFLWFPVPIPLSVLSLRLTFFPTAPPLHAHIGILKVSW